jgi:hypothetical protein
VGGGGGGHVAFGQKILDEKSKCETVRYRGATASSFAAKVRGEVFALFHAVAVKHRSNISN